MIRHFFMFVTGFFFKYFSINNRNIENFMFKKYKKGQNNTCFLNVKPKFYIKKDVLFCTFGKV